MYLTAMTDVLRCAYLEETRLAVSVTQNSLTQDNVV